MFSNSFFYSFLKLLVFFLKKILFLILFYLIEFRGNQMSDQKLGFRLDLQTKSRSEIGFQTAVFYSVFDPSD